MFRTSLIVFGTCVFASAALADPQLAPPPVTPAPAEQVAAPKVVAAPKPPATPRHEWAVSDDTIPSYDAGTLARTQIAADRYAAIVETGGWPQVPAGLTRDSRGPDVTALRKRLSLEGFLPVEAAAGDTFDATVATAIEAFQLNAALKKTGVPAGANKPYQFSTA